MNNYRALFFIFAVSVGEFLRNPVAVPKEVDDLVFQRKLKGTDPLSDMATGWSFRFILFRSMVIGSLQENQDI
jgi:hypothetical protein